MSVTFNATGAVGTDLNGANLSFASGKGTGLSTNTGYIDFLTPDVGVTGTVLQSLSSKMRLLNSGTLRLNGLQTGNAGLSSGDLYVDSAANILANGDLVVGRKV